MCLVATVLESADTTFPALQKVLLDITVLAVVSLFLFHLLLLVYLLNIVFQPSFSPTLRALVIVY